MTDNLPNGPYTGTPLYTTTPEKTGVAWWVWVISGIFVCACLACAGTAGFVSYFGREPEDLRVSYSMTSVVQRDEKFDLTLLLSNTGSETFTISDIDLDEALSGSILDGAVVLETDPHMERDYSISGIKTFKYNETLKPGESKEVIFHMQAITVGEFGGSIGLFVGNIAKRIGYVGIVVQE